MAALIVRALPFLLLAACGSGANFGTGPAGPAEPRSVTLFRDTVTVAMTDGSLCSGVRTARPGPWRTVLAGCPHLWPVAVLRPTAQPRLPLVPAEGAPWVTLLPPGAAALGFAPLSDGA